MIGAIAGDIIGSAYEFHPTYDADFPLFPPQARFTDDTILTLAVAEALLTDAEYSTRIRVWGRRYPDGGYGGRFSAWLAAKAAGPYGSYGNGSAMRVAPAGFAAQSLDEALELARASAIVTHDHPEGIKGARAVAGAIFLARSGNSKEDIRDWIRRDCGYRLDRTLDEIRPGYGFDETCPGSVPEAITAFLESGDWLDAVRKAVLLCGDADTLACIAGGIAQAFYGTMPEAIIRQTRAMLDAPLRTILDRFEAAYPAAIPRAG